MLFAFFRSEGNDRPLFRGAGQKERGSGDENGTRLTRSKECGNVQIAFSHGFWRHEVARIAYLILKLFLL